MIQERLQARVIDLQSQIQRVKDKAAADVAALQRQLNALKAIQPLITPELLDALTKLQATGLLTDL